MKIALLLWPDSFEDWYRQSGIDRASYLSSYEGEWSTTFARMLRAEGADVHLVFATLGRASVEVHRPSGATVHFVPASPLYRAFRQAVWGHRWWEAASRLWPAAPVLSTLSPGLLSRMISIGADVCVIQDYESVRFDVAGPLLHLVGRQHVVAMDLGGSARPRTGLLHRAAVRSAARLLAVNATEEQRARRELHHADVRIWPVPVRTDVFTPTPRAAARSALGVDADAELVVSVGRLHPVKRLHELADACRDVGCLLVVAGAGPEFDSLAARRDPGLRLVGWVSPEEAARWYAAADVVALASTQEGQPTTVLEAFACARGVVATAVGGVPDVVVPGKTGWLVRPRDGEDLRLALKEALSDVAEADRRGSAGRRVVLERHTPEAAAAELLAAFTRDDRRRPRAR